MIPNDIHVYHVSYSWWGRPRTCYAFSNSFSQSSVTRKLKSGFEVRAQEKKKNVLQERSFFFSVSIPFYSDMFLGSNFL